MERNTDLFFAVADAIEAHPEQYDQRTVHRETACGTKHCIAGWGEHLNPALLEACDYRVEDMFGLTHAEAWRSEGPSLGLFHAFWKPHDGLSVPDALRKIGEGASIEDVSA